MDKDLRGVILRSVKDVRTEHKARKDVLASHRQISCQQAEQWSCSSVAISSGQASFYLHFSFPSLADNNMLRS